MSNKLDYKLFYRRYLPHYQPANGIFFITYRLAFSLPQKILQQQQQKLMEFEKRSQHLSEREQQQLFRDYYKIIFVLEDEFLGQYHQGPQWLNNEAIADITLENLFFHDTKHYELICALIMSNHVHIVIKPLLQKAETPYLLARIMKDHKSYVAHEANKILHRTGAFWFHENYDHWVREDQELKRVLYYILQNPVKAGIVKDYRDWKHYWINDAYL